MFRYFWYFWGSWLGKDWGRIMGSLIRPWRFGKVIGVGMNIRKTLQIWIIWPLKTTVVLYRFNERGLQTSGTTNHLTTSYDSLSWLLSSRNGSWWIKRHMPHACWSLANVAVRPDGRVCDTLRMGWDQDSLALSHADLYSHLYPEEI